MESKAAEIVIIIKYPSSSSWFKLFSCGKENINIAKEKIISQFQNWHVTDVGIYAYIECADSEVFKDCVYHKIGKNLHNGTLKNGWMFVSAGEFQARIKKIANKDATRAKIFIEKKPDKKKKIAHKDDSDDE